MRLRCVQSNDVRQRTTVEEVCQESHHDAAALAVHRSVRQVQVAHCQLPRVQQAQAEVERRYYVVFSGPQPGLAVFILVLVRDPVCGLRCRCLVCRRRCTGAAIGFRIQLAGGRVGVATRRRLRLLASYSSGGVRLCCDTRRAADIVQHLQNMDPD